MPDRRLPRHIQLTAALVAYGEEKFPKEPIIRLSLSRGMIIAESCTFVPDTRPIDYGREVQTLVRKGITREDPDRFAAYLMSIEHARQVLEPFTTKRLN